jgi:uncharacterized protein YjdB
MSTNQNKAEEDTRPMKSVINGIVLPHGHAPAANGRVVALTLLLLILPGLLSAQTLLHRYSFVSDASDSVGGPAWTGTVVAPGNAGGSPATINNGLTLPGGGGPGFSGYVSLPAGILTNTSSLTIECWATQNSAQTWAELWSFNNGTGQYIGFIPHPNNNANSMSLAIKNGTEFDAFSAVQFPNGEEQYVAATFNASTLVGRLYTNGALVASVTVPNTNYIPGTYGGAAGTLNNVLGQDPFNDPQFQGTIYELRIWNGAVSQRYLSASAVAGPSVVITNLTPTLASLTAGPNLVLTATEQGNVTVQLSQTGSANLPASADATNWASSNPSVLTVNTNGLISAVGMGSATISAKVAGVSVTSGTITVTGPQTLLHRYSFVSDASDSVGGASGAIVPAGNASGTNVVISNGLVLSGGGGNAYSGYVSLPSGILTNTTSLTIECWLTQNAANTWATPWDFANNGSQNFALIAHPGNNGGNIEVAFTPHGNELDLQSAVAFPNGVERHVCLTYNNSTLIGNLYTNGTLIASRSFPDTTYAPGSIGSPAPGGTTVNALGNDIYGDPQFQGTIYEFRIWNGAQSPVYAAVAGAAGPGVIVTNLTPLSLNVTVTNTSMVGSQTQPAIVVGNFVDATNVTVTGGATNWISSNPSVLTVNSNGLITAVSGGTAKVSATVNGVSATSSTITVAATVPTITQAPASQSLCVGQPVVFSVQALGGGLNYQWSFDATPIGGATNAMLSLSNITFANAGTYSVLVSNSIGTTNVSATLKVFTQILQHRYSFVSDASDSVGGAAWNGTVVPPGNASGSPATINNGLSLPGGGGPGFSGYVSLPAGILTNTYSITVECWVTQNSAQTWAEVWSFNNGTSQYIGLIPSPNNNNHNMSYAVRNGTEYDAFSAIQFPNGSEQYVVATFDAPNLVGRLYTNGALIASVTVPNSTYIPGTYGGAGGTLNNVLGQDPFPDPQFQGTLYELRIWNGLVSPLYQTISAVAGPSVVVTNLTPTSVTVSVANSSMIAGLTQPATVLGNFVDAANVNVTAIATNWTSSNPSVLTVDSSGLVTAVNTGSATVSATVNGVTGTSGLITVPTSAPIITQQPEASETLLVGATLRASVANIGNPPFTYFWYTNGGATPISITASSTLTIPKVQPANAASYTVLVSNRYGTAPLSSPLVLMIVAPTPYQQALLSSGPIAYWPLNEADGTIAYDVIGGYNGTYTNAPSIIGSSFTLAQPGPTNAFFGGTSYSVQFFSAYVDIPGGPFNITNAVSVMAWVELLVTPGFDGLLGHGDPSWRTSINGSSQPGGNSGTSAGDATGPNGFALNTWHMVAYTYTGIPNQQNNGSLYVDGVLAAHNTVVTAPVGDNLDVWIGGAPDYGTARLLPAADIAHAAIFNQALTAAQVQGLYNGTFVPGPQTITIARSGTNVVLNWQIGTLLHAPTVLGPWTTNNAAVPPYTTPATNAAQFFRLLVNP